MDFDRLNGEVVVLEFPVPLSELQLAHRLPGLTGHNPAWQAEYLCCCPNGTLFRRFSGRHGIQLGHREDKRSPIVLPRNGLSALRRLTAAPDRQSWLLLKGKRWKLTAEGQRVRGVVADLVQRYEQMTQFVAGQQTAKPVVSIACGQQAATGFVKAAVERFLKEYPECRIRISTPRGKARIEGVAGGQFDMAIVTDSPATIHRIARMELYIETLLEDRFVLVANPPAKAPWARKWNALPTDCPVTAKELLGLPFILPEPDASRRQQFDDWTHKATGQLPEVVLEAGGWQTILNFAASGVGVGIVPQSSVELSEHPKKVRLVMRSLNEGEFPTDAVRLIARKAHGVDSPDLMPSASEFAKMTRDTISR